MILANLTKRCLHSTTNHSVLLKVFFLVSFGIATHSSLFAQNTAAEGMKGKETNFSTFSERLVLNVEGWKQINQQIYYSHPEFGILPSDAPCSDCVEDLSKRKMDERYFVDNKDPNQYYQQKAMGQLHELIDQQLVVWQLSVSEKDISKLILKGLNMKEIAQIRKTSEATVRQQAMNIYRKANVHSRQEFIAYFLEDL